MKTTVNQIADIHHNFIDELNYLMEKFGLSNTGMAERLGISESYLCMIFTGQRLVGLNMINRVQRVFNIRFELSINNSGKKSEHESMRFKNILREAAKGSQIALAYIENKITLIEYLEMERKLFPSKLCSDSQE